MEVPNLSWGFLTLLMVVFAFEYCIGYFIGKESVKREERKKIKPNFRK